MLSKGRQEILTDEVEITSENILTVLQDAMDIHRQNAHDCDFLIRYEHGEQPLQRTKTYRPDIDIVVTDNIANEITEFKCAFNWSSPITLVQRGEEDSGKKNKAENDAIALLNECYESQGISKKNQELARYIEICGIAHTYIDINTEWEEGDSYFTLTTLDPRTSFVVHSSDVTRKPMLGVTYRFDKNGNTYFTCFTDKQRFEVYNEILLITPSGAKKKVNEWKEISRSGEKNPLGIIPVVEWLRSTDRTGAWERQIPEMDNLNIMVSDYSDSIDQNTQSVWQANDIEFPEDANGDVVTPKSNDWVMTRTTANGKTPFINPLATSYDYGGMLNNIVNRRALILEKCAVPQRTDNTSGATGVATSDATGWSSAESSACKEQAIISPCKMQEVKVVLKAIQKSGNVPQDSPLLKLRAIDVVPSIKRQKTYEMVTKLNAFAVGVTHGLDYKALVKAINFFDDPQQVIIDSEPTMKKFIEKTFGTEQQTAQMTAQKVGSDESDQIGNSPTIDGTSKENPEGSKESKKTDKPQPTEKSKEQKQAEE